MSLFLLAFAACTTESPADLAAADLQLEAASVATDACEADSTCDGSDLATGTLAVTRGAGDASVDLELTVGEDTFTVHSPTGADLAEHVGDEVIAAVRAEWMVPGSLMLRDDEGPVYVVESGAGNAFAALEVRYGEVLGQLVDEEDYQLTFRTLAVTTDDGVVEVKPGEVVTLHVDGATYRFAGIAAYEVDTLPGGEYSDCGGELPMLSYELVRITTAQTFPAVVRPEGLGMALYSGCGG